jgi:AraC-like DNA-binding protein
LNRIAIDAGSGHDAARQNIGFGMQKGGGAVTETSVSAGYARAIVDVAVARGADRAALVALAGHDPAAASGPDDRVAFPHFKALMRAAATTTGDPAFPLHFGAESRFDDISIVGLITHAATTMAEAFAEMNRFARLAVEVEGHDSGDRFVIVKRDGETWIEDRHRNPNDFPELSESTFARFIWTTARGLGPVPFARAVHFTHTAPPHSAAHARILGVPVTFGSDRNAIAVDDGWLSLPLPRANRYVFGLLIDHAEGLLAAMAANASVRGQVETAVLAVLHTGRFGMATIAGRLGMGRSTLYRRLHAEGATYDGVVDALRHRMALHYLAGRKVSVSETAYLVGFSDPASFSRAFRRWTGAAPGAHRRG